MKANQLIRPTYIISAFILFFFGKHLLPINDDFIGGIDIGGYFFWNIQFTKEQLLSGNIPLWNPYYYCGHPFLANPSTFVFYPSMLLFLLLPMPWAFNIDTILHLYLAAMGIYFFVFMLTQSKSTGIAASIVYSLSGYFMDRIFAGHLTLIHAAALLPWIFYFFEKGYTSKRAVFFLVSGVILGLQILSSDPQIVFYTAIFLTVYSFVRHYSTPRSLRFVSFHNFGIYFFIIPIFWCFSITNYN